MRSRRLFASALGRWWRLCCSHIGSLYSFHATSSIGRAPITSRVHITGSLCYWRLVGCYIKGVKSTGNQCVSNGDVINSQEHLRKDLKWMRCLWKGKHMGFYNDIKLDWQNVRSLVDQCELTIPTHLKNKMTMTNNNTVYTLSDAFQSVQVLFYIFNRMDETLRM